MSVNQIVGTAPYNLDELAPGDSGLKDTCLVETVQEKTSEWMLQSKRKGKTRLGAIAEEPNELLRFTEEDVQEELQYWKTAVYGFVLGVNPHVDVMEGFIRRLWAKFPIDKVSFCPNGVFLVRFKTSAARDLILQQSHFLFDNKPLIVRPWKEDVVLEKEAIKDVLVWIWLHNLPVKFWGKCLPKIAGLLGSFVYCDTAIVDKTRLGFARVMVDVPFGAPIPDSVRFLDEDGCVVKIRVEFEWKPLLCSKCKGIGHETASCKKAKVTEARKVVVQQKRK
ncbi:uncharacterized protein LOC141655205 [Silene latifolia]|uniref:uncharacterized protein LOC141655205 n=1 Tax=Silene latifolia TaxID=37657 RepID=UPI003D779CA4